MKKEEIFPLYIGKCEVLTLNGTKTYWSCDLGTSMIEHTKSSVHGDASCISDCSLILKRISNMNAIDRVNLAECFKMKTNTMIAYLNGEQIYIDKQTVHGIDAWLKEHGCALNDEWFNNGIAVEVGK